MVFEFTQFQLEKNRDLVCNADDTDKLIIYGATSCEEWFINVHLMYFFAHTSATGSVPQNQFLRIEYDQVFNEDIMNDFSELNLR